jgi:transglutaminase-like putative cysteine protease
MFDYMSVVDPLSVRRQAMRIVVPLANQHPWNWHQAAAVFDFVRGAIRYVPDPRGIDYVAPPLETMEIGGGDCDDHAVLVSSLCESVGIPTRIVFCRGPEENHVLCQVDFGRQDGLEVGRNLSLYYSGRLPDAEDGFFWQTDRGSLWVFADTAMCRYLGDIRPLVERGYVDIRGDRSRWTWRKPIEVFSRNL